MEPFEGIRVVELAVAVQGPGAGGRPRAAREARAGGQQAQQTDPADCVVAQAGAAQSMTEASRAVISSASSRPVATPVSGMSPS